MTTEVQYGKPAKERLAAGVKKLVETVAQTLGANGSNVTLIDNLNHPIVTKDGVTVAKSIRLHDFVENAGADIVKQAAMSSAELAGDGTTTSTVIAGKIIELGLEIPEELNMFDVRKGMEKAVEFYLNKVEQEKIDLTVDKNLLENVATISANNNPEMGALVANLVHSLGKGSTITISKERKDETYIDKKEGYTFEKPLVSDWLTQVQGDVYSEIENPKLLVVDDNLRDIKDVIKVLEEVDKRGDSLVIMANSFGEEFIQLILQNIYKKSIDINKFSMVETPNYNDRRTESLVDILRCTGANLMSINLEGTSLSDFKYEDLGDIAFFRADDLQTTFILNDEGSKQADIIVKELSDRVKDKSGSLKDRVEERIRRLSKGSAILYIGAKTDTEHKELYDLYEDSIKACQSALEEGVVQGGGLALFKASMIEELDFLNESENKGAEIIKQAISEPIRRIISSTGKNLEGVLKAIEANNFEFGFNAKTGKLESMINAGIVDPFKVTRVAVQSALSSANTILTTNAIVFPFDFESKKEVNYLV